MKNKAEGTLELDKTAFRNLLKLAAEKILVFKQVKSSTKLIN